MADNKKLYDNLLKSGKITSNEIGDFNTFDSLLQDKSNAVKLYNNLRKNDLFTANEIGDENTFMFLVQSQVTPIEPEVETLDTKVEKAKEDIYGISTKPWYMNQLEPTENTFSKKIRELLPRSVISTEEGQPADILLDETSFDKVDIALDIVNNSINELASGRPSLTFVMPISNIPVNVTIGSKDIDKLVFAKEMLLKAQKIKEAPKKDGLKAFWQGLTSPIARDFLSIGINELGRNVYVMNASKKLQRGEELTDEEETLLGSYNLLQQIRSGKNLPQSYKIAAGVSEMIPYIVQFGITQGTSALVNQGIKGLVNAAGKTTIKNFAGKSLAYTGAAAAQATLMPMTYSNISERLIGEVSEKDGVLISRPKESTVSSITRGYINSVAETFGEGMGGILSGTVGNTAKKIALKKGFWETFSKSLQKTAGWNGLWEVPEEEVTGLIQSVVDNDWGFFTPSEQLTMIGTVALMSGAMYGMEQSGKKIDKIKEIKLQKTVDAGLKNLDELNDLYPGIKESTLDIANSPVADWGDKLNTLKTEYNLDEQNLFGVVNFLYNNAKNEAYKESKSVSVKEEPIAKPSREATRYTKNGIEISKDVVEETIENAINPKDLAGLEVNNDDVLEKKLLEKHDILLKEEDLKRTWETDIEKAGEDQSLIDKANADFKIGMAKLRGEKVEAPEVEVPKEEKVEPEVVEEKHAEEVVPESVAEKPVEEAVPETLIEQKVAEPVSEFKNKQLDIINKSNPMLDEIHTGIRSVDDIKTAQEAFQESIDNNENPTEDFTVNDIQNSLKAGKITVYSSYPIENGVFVTPSKMQAKSYSGTGKVYSKEVLLDDVAWIDSFEGQYAKVETVKEEKEEKLPEKKTEISELQPSVKQEVPESEQKIETVKQKKENIRSEFGHNSYEILKNYIDHSGEELIDYDRLINTTRNILKINPDDKVSAFAEALQYEMGYPDNWQDLRDAINKGGFERNRQAVERMIEVGVSLPKDISDLAEKYKEKPTEESKPIPKPEKKVKEPYEMTKDEYAPKEITINLTGTKPKPPEGEARFYGRSSLGSKTNSYIILDTPQNREWAKNNRYTIAKNQAPQSYNREYGHKEIIKQAKVEGKTIPENVKAEYPELFKEEKKPSEKPTAKPKDEKVDFEKKHGISSEKLAEQINSFGKTFRHPIEEAYKLIKGEEYPYGEGYGKTEEEAKNHREFLSDFLSDIGQKRIKLKIPIEIDGHVDVRVVPEESKPLKEGGIESLKNIVTKDDLRPVMGGIYFDEGNLVATDAYQLVIIKNNENQNIILKKLRESATKRYSKVAGGDSLEDLVKGEVEKAKKGGINGKIINLRLGGVVEGNFPAYKSVIPQNPIRTMDMPIDDLIKISNGANNVFRNIDGTAKVLVLHFTGEIDELVGMNPQYLFNVLQTLKANGAKSIRIGVSAPNRALTVYADNGNFGLIMPMMIENESGNYTTTQEFELKTSITKEAKGKPKLQAEEKGYSFFAKALGLVKTDLVSSLGKTARNGKINGVDVVIQQGDNANEAIIESIRTPWLFRNLGKGTKALNKIIAEADKMGITLKLRAVPEKGAKISQQQLQSWYEKNGFVFAEGSNKGVRSPNIRLQAGERLVPVPKTIFDNILQKLFGTKLAKAIITDKAKMLEKLNQYGIKKLGEPTDKVSYMATTAGEVYGFTTPEGEIYIDPEKININTPIHEYGHLWINWAKTQAKDLFDKGMKLADDKTNPYFQKIWNNPAYLEQRKQYEQGNKDAFLEEVLATAIGDKGEQFVNAKQKSDFKQWLKDLFEAIKEVLGISQYTAEQLQDITFDEFSKAVAVELLKGEEIKARSNIDKATQLYYDLLDAEGASKKRSLAKQRRELLENDPRLKYIDDNIKEINSQLEKQGIIKKEGACP